MFGIEKVKTMPYHAQCNGQVERFHQTLIMMVGKIWHDWETDRRKHLPKVVQTYIGTCLAIMGYSPYYLMFGQCPRLPIDLYFPTVCLGKQCSLPSYLATLHERLQAACEATHVVSQAETQCQKHYYNR